MNPPNRVAIGLSAIFGGAAAGAAVATVLVWVSWKSWGWLSIFGDPRNIIFAGNFVLAPLTAFLVAWRYADGIDETWRRTAMAFTAAMGAFAGAWAAFPVSMLALMMSSPFLSMSLVPAYFLIMLLVWYACSRGQKRQRVGTATAAGVV
jgi:hypothetical protein